MGDKLEEYWHPLFATVWQRRRVIQSNFVLKLPKYSVLLHLFNNPARITKNRVTKSKKIQQNLMLPV